MITMMPRSAGMKAGYEAELNDKKGNLELGKETLEQLYMFPSTDVQIKESPELTLKYEQALKNAEMACNALGSTVKTVKLAVETLNHLVCVCSLFDLYVRYMFQMIEIIYIWSYLEFVLLCYPYKFPSPHTEEPPKPKASAKGKSKAKSAKPLAIADASWDAVDFCCPTCGP